MPHGLPGATTSVDRCNLSDLARRILSVRFPMEASPETAWDPPRPDWTTGLPDLEVLRSELNGVQKRGRKVVLYGHDDMDGISGLFVGMRILLNQGFRVIPIIPRSATEEYGIQPGRLKGLLKPGDLLLTVDYGCSAVEGVLWARTRGARIVITDHHTLNPPLPDAHGLIDPQSIGGPATDLAGCGVLYAALTTIYPRWEDDDQLLAVVALGSVSDRVPLRGWNRYLLSRFSDVRMSRLTAGLRHLMNEWPCRESAWSGAMVRAQITSTIGKGFNSGITRILQFMFSNDQAWCLSSWREMQAKSIERGHLLGEYLSRAMKSKDPQADAYGMILVFLDSIPSGMGGTLASRLCKVYRRGTIVVSRRNDGTLGGDTRSLGDWNMAGFLLSMKHLFTSAGGHYRAAGFSSQFTDWEVLREHLISRMSEYPANPVPKPHVDLTLDALPDPSELTCLAPFGPGFLPPAIKVGAMRYLLQITTGNPHWCITEDSGE
jgi:single-stranded-DNA-specific exonuclease